MLSFPVGPSFPHRLPGWRPSRGHGGAQGNAQRERVDCSASASSGTIPAWANPCNRPPACGQVSRFCRGGSQAARRRFCGARLSQSAWPRVLSSRMDSCHSYDVAILGGGLAGLTLARQLHQERPELRTLVLEKRPHPVPEAAHKVGESSVEIGAHYFGAVLGLEPYFDEHQLTKFGLRYFFSDGSNRDLGRRFELGRAGFPVSTASRSIADAWRTICWPTTARAASRCTTRRRSGIELGDPHRVTFATTAPRTRSRPAGSWTRAAGEACSSGSSGSRDVGAPRKRGLVARAHAGQAR